MKAKNGDGYIRKNKRGKYECTITSTCVDPVTQNYKRIKRTADTREEATKLAKQALRAYEKEWKLENKYNDSLTLLFSEACEEYLEKKVRPTVKGSTFYTYQNNENDKQKVDEYKNTIESKFPYDEQNINVFSA